MRIDKTTHRSHLKAVVIGALTAGLVISGAGGAVAEHGDDFTDVPPEHTFYEEINWLAHEGITTGWDVGGGETEFRPTWNVTRQAVAAFLYRYNDVQGDTDCGVEGKESGFTDVPDDHPFCEEIAWLASTGITTGWDSGDGTQEFRPSADVTRQAVAAFVYRYEEEFGEAITDPATCDSGFVDVEEGHAFCDEISWLAGQEITTGWDLGDGTEEFRPAADVTRQAVAAFLFRYERLDYPRATSVESTDSNALNVLDVTFDTDVTSVENDAGFEAFTDTDCGTESGATVDSATASGDVVTVTYNENLGTEGDEISVRVAAGTVQDAQGNPNVESQCLSVTLASGTTG